MKMKHEVISNAIATTTHLPHHSLQGFQTEIENQGKHFN